MSVPECPAAISWHGLYKTFQVFVILHERSNHPFSQTGNTGLPLLRILTRQLCDRLLVLRNDDFIARFQLIDKILQLCLGFFECDRSRHGSRLVINYETDKRHAKDSSFLIPAFFRVLRIFCSASLPIFLQMACTLCYDSQAHMIFSLVWGLKKLLNSRMLPVTAGPFPGRVPGLPGQCRGRVSVLR